MSYAERILSALPPKHYPRVINFIYDLTGEDPEDVEEGVWNIMKTMPDNLKVAVSDLNEELKNPQVAKRLRKVFLDHMKHGSKIPQDYKALCDHIHQGIQKLY